MEPKILIADDDFDNRTILKQILEANRFRVVLAIDGQEAVDVALQERPDFIFLDLSMPRMNGWEAVRRIRQLPEIAGTPIFAFTAHALQGDEAKAKAAGCDGYVAKPCVPKEVVEMMRARLGIAGRRGE